VDGKNISKENATSVFKVEDGKQRVAQRHSSKDITDETEHTNADVLNIHISRRVRDAL
jgi:hypothetical protein